MRTLHCWRVLHTTAKAAAKEQALEKMLSDLGSLCKKLNLDAYISPQTPHIIRQNFALIGTEIVPYDVCSESDFETGFEFYAKQYGAENIEYLGLGSWHHQECLDLRKAMA